MAKYNVDTVHGEPIKQQQPLTITHGVCYERV